MVWVYFYVTYLLLSLLLQATDHCLLFTSHRPLFTAHCSLHIANCSSAPKRNSPAQAPGIPYLQYSMRKSGALRRGGLGGGGPRGTGLSERLHRVGRAG